MASAASFAAMIGSAGDATNRFMGLNREAGAVRAQGAYTSAADTMNARLATAQGADAIQRGDVAAFTRGAATKQQIGSSTTAMAAQGLNLQVGSPVDVVSTEAKLGALDEATIRNNAARQAWGYQVQAADYAGRARLAKASATNEADADEANAYSGLLTGAVKTYGLYRARKQ